MSYLGNAPALAYTSFAKQDFTTSATTSYTLDNPVTNANELALFINFVRQEPTTAYSASGTSLVLTSATASSDDMYCVYLGQALQTVNPANASVGSTQLSPIAITGQTAEATIADGDTILIHDASASALRKMTKANFVSGIGGTNTPAFLAKLSANVENQSGDSTIKIPFNSEIFDTHSAYDHSSNYRFTCPSGHGGKYNVFLHLHVRDQGQNDNYRYVTGRIYKNGSFYTEYQRAFGGNNLDAAFSNHVNISLPMVLDATDYIEFYVKVYNTTFKMMEESSNAGAYKIIE